MSEHSKKGLFHYKHIVQEQDGTLTIGTIKGIPDISAGGIGEPAAWFMGPRAENADLFRRMIELAMHEAADYRTEYKPGDPEVITEEVKASQSYKDAVANMELSYRKLVDFLKQYSTPFFSMRYQGHMLWDNTMPALCAYFATMLHNPNNVTIQASAATTPLEILVGWDLCSMVGFTGHDDLTEQEYNPWAHLTCDGSVANIEAAWACRETKFFPFALRRMLLEDETYSTKQPLYEIIVETSAGKFIDLVAPKPDTWDFFNIPMDKILGLPKLIAEAYEINDEYAVWSAAVPFTLNYVGWANMLEHIRTLNPHAKMPVMIAPSTMHYSWPKAAAFCGYGFGAPTTVKQKAPSSGCMFNVPVDTNARMDMKELEQILARCNQEHLPVTMVVGVMGSTEEGAVDPLKTILDTRCRYRKKGLEYFIHADAAWGGYMISAMRKPYTFSKGAAMVGHDPEYATDDLTCPFVPKETSCLSDHVYEQYSCLRQCDSITIDPHKMGYLQYPAGSILYRNGIIRRLTTFTGAYIGGTGSVDPGIDPTVGIFGLEGSRPGASAAAVYLNHRVIRPHLQGHGKIVRESMINTKVFAARILSLNRLKRYYKVTLLTKQSNLHSLVGDTCIGQMKPAEILAQVDSNALRNFGPDLNLLDYVFNPISKKTGQPNTCLQTLNEFNQAVYNKFHTSVQQIKDLSIPTPSKDVPDFFLTKTTFDRAAYGGAFIDDFVERIFRVLPAEEIKAVDCLRSVVMDPFMRYAQGGSFFLTILEVIDTTVQQIAESKDWC